MLMYYIVFALKEAQRIGHISATMPIEMGFGSKCSIVKCEMDKWLILKNQN